MINEFTLGRIPAPDDRDKSFVIRRAAMPPTITSRYWNDNSWWGDQLQVPACVGFSWAHWVEDGPVTQGGTAPIVDPMIIYTEAQKIDEWPGENYGGTSVRAGAKYLQSIGVIAEYNWAWDLQTLITTVLTTGPVVVGTSWYENMFYPNTKGLIKIGGEIAGGHAYVINGVSTISKLFRIKNSWSRTWGKNGRAFISFADMQRLIDEEGEICLGVEVRL